MPNDPVFVREIEEFLYHEARLLDDRQFEDWMALFAKDGVYWIPAMPEQEDPLGEASIAYEDLQFQTSLWIHHVRAAPLVQRTDLDLFGMDQRQRQHHCC